jgi:iron-sulfur cluster assembly protein
MFKITTSAAEQIKVAAEQGGTEGMALRFATKENQDGSFDYNMGFDNSTEEDDPMTCEGIEVVIDPAYMPLLEETTLDYVEMDDGESQFVFLNPLDPTYVPPKEDKDQN